MVKILKPLIIGHYPKTQLEIKVPIIQGAMGVRISMADLAAAVAECGGAGTIATAFFEPKELPDEIVKARKLSKGVIGVNIMRAVTQYKELVYAAVKGNADFIAIGAGLALDLPKLVEKSSIELKLTGISPIKLIPIVSSAKAARIIIEKWKRQGRIPDAFIVEGPLAGGHLGFKVEQLESMDYSLEKLVVEVLDRVRLYEKEFNASIPIIAAGGIFDGRDIAKFIRMGAQGVQMATRFVATDECSVHANFKQAYIDAEGTTIIVSPVGMPGRAIKNIFIEKLNLKKSVPFICKFRCLEVCDPKTAPYCIADALTNAYRGNIDNAVIFAGSNVGRVTEIVPVKKLMDELVQGTKATLNELNES